MSVEACARIVEKGDPDRFLATMAAPAAARDRLWPLYAFNLELARAPWVASEPAIAEMRLQWWIDTLDRIAGGEVSRAHEVAAPLADLIRGGGLPVAPLQAIAEARRFDCWAEPFAGDADLAAYLDATAGGLMWAAALALGAPPEAEGMVRDYGFAAGLASLLRALPELAARGRHPLGDPSPEEIAGLAQGGLASLARGRAALATLPLPAHPALYPGWQSGPLLRLAARDPAAVAAGRLRLSEFQRRGRLLWITLTGRP